MLKYAISKARADMIFSIIVIYNKECKKIPPINTLLGYKNLKIIIYDNSTVKNCNKEWCKENSIKYFGYGENHGLSRAYNKVIDDVSMADDDYILVLDDDTNITNEYIEKLLDRTKRCDADIFLPIVKAGSKIISPCNIKYGCFSSPVNSNKTMNVGRLTAINSGMCIRRAVFYKCRYNESLFLDYIDHDFMDQIRINRFQVSIINSYIIQNYSRMEKPLLNIAINRFKIQSKDIYEYYRVRNSIQLYYLSLGKFVIIQSIRYKTLQFIYILLKHKA